MGNKEQQTKRRTHGDGETQKCQRKRQTERQDRQSSETDTEKGREERQKVNAEGQTEERGGNREQTQKDKMTEAERNKEREKPGGWREGRKKKRDGRREGGDTELQSDRGIWQETETHQSIPVAIRGRAAALMGREGEGRLSPNPFLLRVAL